MSVRIGGEASDNTAPAFVGQDSAADTQRHKSGLLARLCCPLCHSEAALAVDDGPELRCPDCNTDYPIVAGGVEWIPWLFRRPDIARLEWSARLKGFIHQNTVEGG